MNKLYTADELSKVFKVSKDTIWRWGRQKKLNTVRIGRLVRFEMPERKRDEIQGR